LPKLTGVTADPYGSLVEWKEHNKRKIIGCFPMHIPEEIIHAAGMLPVAIWESAYPITFGQGYIRPFNCGLTRSFVDDAVCDRLGFMDGMLFYDTCLQARGLPFVIGRAAPPAFLDVINLPAMIANSTTRPFLVESLERFKAVMEELAGQKITSESLKQSIAVYDKNRAMLRRLYELRRVNPGLLKAREVLAIVRSSMLMLKEEHNQLLEQLLPQLEGKQAAAEGKVRVVLSGSLCQAPSADVLNLIEEVGMVVVDDELYTGYRYCAHDAGVNGNPIEALADRYLQRIPPCPTRVDPEIDWTDYIMETANRSGARGIITLLVKYCPPHLTYCPDIKRRLNAAGVREISIETEHEVVSLEQVRTRLQAFVETVRGA